MIDLLIFALADDGDVQRLVRRKLLSPVLKVIGAAVGNKYFAIDICETAKDNKEEVDYYLQRANKTGVAPLNEKIETKAPTAQLEHKVSFGA